MSPGLPREVGEMGKKQRRRREGREPGEQVPGAREESHGYLAGQWQSTDLNPDPGFESSTLFFMSTTPGPKMMPVEGLGDTQG